MTNTYLDVGRKLCSCGCGDGRVWIFEEALGVILSLFWKVVCRKSEGKKKKNVRNVV